MNMGILCQTHRDISTTIFAVLCTGLHFVDLRFDRPHSLLACPCFDGEYFKGLLKIVQDLFATEIALIFCYFSTRYARTKKTPLTLHRRLISVAGGVRW